MLGLWIDSLDSEQRDRIIEHSNPTFSGRFWWCGDEDRGCGCLVGCVLRPEVGFSNPAWLPEEDRRYFYWDTVGCRFPLLTKRFGAERMWRVCKLRAAKRNRVNVEGGALATVGAL